MGSRTADTGQAQLLVHLPEHGVVVCRHCAFAVEPRALSIHLLRHQIYRNERKELLDDLSALDLKEPDEVDTPPPGSPPISSLTTYNGSMCDVEDCGHAFISQKRMAQHLSEEHGEEAPQIEHTRPATLQTFFWGKNAKFFEIAGEAESLDHSSGDPDTSDSPGITPFLRGPGTLDIVSLANAIVSDADVEESNLPVELSTSHLDMSSLRYLHHFMTTLGNTLQRGTESSDFSTVIAIQEALRQEYLMNGILGVSAYHMAMGTADSTIQQVHEQSGRRYQHAGLAAFREVLESPQSTNITSLICFARSVSIQRCVQTYLEAGHPHPGNEIEDSPTAPLLEFLLLLREPVDMLYALQDRLSPESDLFLRPEVLNGVIPLTSDQLVTGGIFPYLLHNVIEHLEASMAKDFEGQPYIPKLHDLIDDRDLTRLTSEALLLNTEEEITEDWIRTTLPHWKIYGTKGKRLVNAFRASVVSSKTAFDEGEAAGTPPPMPPMSRFPGITVEEYNKIVALPVKMAEILEPEDLVPIPDVLPELVALLHSYARANAFDGVAAAFNGVEAWPRAISNRYVTLVEERCPAALILFGAWCALLKRLEGIWFFAGLPRRLAEIAVKNLPEGTSQILEDLYQGEEQK